MHAELLQRAAELARREEPFVVALVVRREPASSAQAGDMALVGASGEFHGWLGGSCIQPTVVREARLALADGKPRLLSLAPDPDSQRRPGVATFPMICHSGGTVEIYLEPVLPAPRLAVFGGSPVARALVKLGKAMGYTVVAADPDADPGLFQGADQVVSSLAALADAPARPRFIVVATMGENDEAAIREALALAPDYLGVVASGRRFAQMRELLAARGVPAAALDTIHSPAGVSIGARTPQEIALSILAEIVAEQRAAEAQVLAAPAAVPVATQAIDPICGMTVEVATARHTAVHTGRTFYFCCGGCRERFLAEPERYAAATDSALPTPPEAAA